MAKRSEVVSKWKGLLLDTYPEDTQRFLLKEKDHFANPVGSILFSELENLYDLIARGAREEELLEPLDRMIRIRAVQDFKPSEAVGFILGLKGIVRSVFVKPGVPDPELEELLGVFESQMERLVLLAFDVYWECKRHLQDLRIKEIKNQYSRLLRMANLTVDLLEESPAK